jgi:DNA-binding MarR family transcriptional regulator
MPTPFAGFRPPTENWSKLPHEFIDVLPQVETIGEMKVILYILRHTWGFQDTEKKITVDEFVNGRKRRDGSRLDSGTGLSAPTVRNGLDRAEAHGFIAVETDERDKGRIRKYYSLVMQAETEQGEKVLPPDGKGFTPRGQKVLPRTEKETLERNSREKPIGADAPEETPLMPPPVKEKKVKPKSNGPPAAARVYRNVMARWPRKPTYPILQEKVGDSEEDLEFWRQVVRKYLLLGWNPMNLDGMLEWYKRRELPEVNRNRASPSEPRSWGPLREWMKEDGITWQPETL